MKCTSCGAEIRDPEALYCARCGRPLGRAGEPPAPAPPTTEHPVVSTTEGSEQTYDPGPAPPVQGRPSEATSSEQETAPQGPTYESSLPGSLHYGAQTDQPSTGPPQQEAGTEAQSPTVPVRDFAVALQRSFVSGGWAQAAGAAAIGFLTLVGLGAVIVAAGAIGSPGFGTGIDALYVLSLVVLFALSILGVSLEFGFDAGFGGEGAAFSMVWLGALVVFGYALSWATARAVADRDAPTPRAQMIEGAKVAVPFSLYCLLAALLFKISSGGSTLGASAPQALFFGLFWAAIFGAIGGLRSGGSLVTIWGRFLDAVKAKRRSVYEGVASGGVMLGTTGLAAAAAWLLIIIVALARGDSLDGLTVGGVVASLVLLTLTLPNILSLIASLALGAPLSGFGAVGLGGDESISIIGFGGRTAGGLVLLLLLIPLLSCLLGGFSAYRQSIDRSKLIQVLACAATTYAGTLALLSLLNRASFDALVPPLDVASSVSANFFAVALLGSLWAGVFGFAGWKLAEMQSSDSPGQSDAGRVSRPA
ncbi:MAG: hypothetical protein ACRDK3_16725 [Actinomycetota bacterium]